MTLSIKPIPFKPPRLSGLSENMTATHYEEHYGGAVQHLNEIQEQLEAMDWLESTPAAINKLKQAQLTETNNVLLHEVYFDSLGGEDGLGAAAVEPEGDIAAMLKSDFGSVEEWREQFVAMGKTLTGGTGWVVLQWCNKSRQLENTLLVDNAQGSVGAVPLLAIDMFSHAYEADHGSNVAAYIEAFMANIHWGRAAQRFAQANDIAKAAPIKVSDQDPISPEELRDQLARGATPVILDVCLLDDLPKRHDKLPQALCWKSDEVSESIASLPTDTPIVAYCMYGYQVSAGAVDAIRASGLEVRQLAGGISAWRAIGESTEPYDV